MVLNSQKFYNKVYNNETSKVEVQFFLFTTTTTTTWCTIKNISLDNI